MRRTLLEVRGEVYMAHDDFAALNDRQAAQGGKDIRQPAQCRRRVFAPVGPGHHPRAPLALFRLCVGRVSEPLAATQSDAVARLERLGFATTRR